MDKVMQPEVFCVPIFDKILLYAPLTGVVALINTRAAVALAHAGNDPEALPVNLIELSQAIYAPTQDPSPKVDAPLDPIYLGIIPTRGCNIGCRYCDFAASKNASPAMSAALGRQAVDAYLKLITQAGHTEGQIHFFGGEPFYAPALVRSVVEYATARTAASGMKLRFEATTNGVYGSKLCQWIGDHFDTVILSLDGLPGDHDRHRPALNGRGTFETVARSARIFSQSRAELIVRACVTAESVASMPDFAHWIGVELKPSTVCFETLSLSPLAIEAGFTPPDPHDFARCFDRSDQILRGYGIQTVTSSADLSETRTSFCPVSKDALIVSPDGAVDACYLLEEDWQERGLDMRLGWLKGSDFEIEAQALRRVRGMNAHNRPLCADCLCRFHCAGGCYVHHDTHRPAGQFDDWCVQTRLITVTQLLRRMGQDALAEAWLADLSAWQTAVWRSSDRLSAASQSCVIPVQRSIQT